MPDTARTIYQRLHAVMKRVDYIQKEKKQGMRYSIVSHDAVTAKVRPVMVEEGVIYWPIQLDHQQNGNRTECSMTVRFQNVDDPNDHIDVRTFGYGIDEQDKGPGKAMSYAVKYALLKALGLESGDDPDEEQEKPVESQLFRELRAELQECSEMVELGAIKTRLGKAKTQLTPAEVNQLAREYNAAQVRIQNANDNADAAKAG